MKAELIFCKHRAHLIPYLLADFKCQHQFYHVRGEVNPTSLIFTDLDFGDDRLEVMWPRLLKRIAQEEASGSSS